MLQNFNPSSDHNNGSLNIVMNLQDHVSAIKLLIGQHTSKSLMTPCIPIKQWQTVSLWYSTEKASSFVLEWLQSTEENMSQIDFLKSDFIFQDQLYGASVVLENLGGYKSSPKSQIRTKTFQTNRSSFRLKMFGISNFESDMRVRYK